MSPEEKEALQESSCPEFSRTISSIVIGILIISGLLSALTAGVLPSGGGPDERAHYSYVQHLAREPIPFPARFEKIYTGDQTRPNQVIHPPAYHYLMAVAYRTLQVDRQLTETGRELDEFGLLTADTVTPILRTASLALVLLHLLGFFLLLRLFVRQRIIPAWTAIPIAAASSWAPATVFISGTMNNDVLIRALWPWVVLVIAQYFFTEHPTYLWGAVALLSVGVLTKGTFWLFAAMAAAFAGLAMLKRDGRYHDGSFWALRERDHGSWMHRLIPVLGTSLAGFTLWYLGAMVIRYGSLQPSFTTVFGMPVTESPFYRASVAGRDDGSPLAVAAAIRDGLESMVSSYVGVLGQQERILNVDSGTETRLLLGLATISAALAVWALLQGGRSKRAQIGQALVLTALFFAATYVVRSWRTFLVLGNFGAQGRYLIGYIDVWLIGSVALGWEFLNARSSRRIRFFYAGIFGSLLIVCLALLARPFHYFDNTVQIHERVGVEQLVQLRAEQAGLTQASLSQASASTATRIPVSRSGRILPSDSWTLPDERATLQAPVPASVPGQGCLVLQLHTRSLGNGQLEVASGTGGGADEAESLQEVGSIQVPDGLGVVREFLPDVAQGTLLLRPSPDSSQLDVLQAFAGWTSCP